EDDPENLVVIVSVYINPEADDHQKINRFNYGATRLAIKRAMDDFPSIDKVLEEKDKAGHPIMGTRTVKLKNPPYLQIAMDKPVLDQHLRLMEAVPESDHLI
ncbi:MAG: formaldehyde-activating enzyme, partial [Candidatus Aenigmatarchaeota archaeon]